jgi:hypothetical protein
MAANLTQVEHQFLLIAARLFEAAMIFSTHIPDYGQQVYLDRKVKDEMVRIIYSDICIDVSAVITLRSYLRTFSRQPWVTRAQ